MRRIRTKQLKEMGRLASAKAASRETGIAYTSLRDLVFRGEIPVIKIGTAWYFDRRDLERFIENAKETPGA